MEVFDPSSQHTWVIPWRNPTVRPVRLTPLVEIAHRTCWVEKPQQGLGKSARAIPVSSACEINGVPPSAVLRIYTDGAAKNRAS